MTLNKSMHPRNPYKDSPPNFKQLASEFADFRQHCTLGSNGKIQVNFQEDDAVRALTRALFKKDFDLEVNLPKGSLVPRIPQKLNYLLWIEDLLKRNNLSQDVVGIDVGTGASCVHALLGVRHFGWKFIATDADEMAAENAHRNVQQNKLDESVKVALVEESSILKEIARQFPDTGFTFCMCNPPFFESEETEKKFVPDQDCPTGVLNNNCDVIPDLTSWRPPPRSATLARKNELQVEGGEVAFVGKMIEESILMQTQVQIYTSMLGKKSSVAALKTHLSRVLGVRYVVGTLNQGRTQRWVLAWTFRPDLVVEETVKPLLMIPGDQLASLPIPPEKWIEGELRQLDVQVHKHTTENAVTFQCEASVSTWTNQRLRRRAAEQLNEPSTKRLRLHQIDAGVQTRLGEGDGRDSLSTAGNIDSCHTVDVQDKWTTVAIQTYLPASCPQNYLIRFGVRVTRNDVIRANCSLIFEFVEGSKQSLHQLIQYLRNRLKNK